MRGVLAVRAPTRISLAGGGTDLEAYYADHGGMVVSAAIDLYTRVAITPAEGEGVEVTSDGSSSWTRGGASSPGLALPHAALRYFGIWRGIRVHLASDVPPGTGLGSSSSMAVGLAKGLSQVLGRPIDAREAAEVACELEIRRMGMPIGRQDQYAAAFGGLNAFTFTAEGIEVEPLSISRKTRSSLLERLMLFYTGSSRSSSTILRQQRRRTATAHRRTLDALHSIKSMASDARLILERGDVDRLGELLHESWLQKKSLSSSISSAFIDECYELARRHGALGGKITGAGGGGFLLLFCPPESQPSVARALGAEGLRQVRFGFDLAGVQVEKNSLSVDPRTLQTPPVVVGPSLESEPTPLVLPERAGTPDGIARGARSARLGGTDLVS